MKTYTYEATTIPLDQLVAVAQAHPLLDTVEMNEIVRRFEPLVRSIVQRLGGPLHLRDDVANAARFALVEAVRRHDQARVGFPKYASIFMFRAGQRVLQRHRRYSSTVLAWEHIQDSVDHAAEERLYQSLGEWGEGALAEMVAKLNPRQLRLVEMRYREDKPLSAIATVYGISESAVSQQLRTVHRIVVRRLSVAA